MGREGWIGFYTANDHDSTAEMANSEHLYGACLKLENDRTIFRLNSKKRSSVGKFRTLYGSFCDDVLLLGLQVHGWNTGWSPALSGWLADTEEGVALLLGGLRPLQSKGSLSAIFDRLEPWVMGEKVALPTGQLAYPVSDGLNAGRRLKRLREGISRIEQTAQDLNPRGRELLRLEATGRLMILEAMLEGGGISWPGQELRAKMRPAPKSRLR